MTFWLQMAEWGITIQLGSFTLAKLLKFRVCLLAVTVQPRAILVEMVTLSLAWQILTMSKLHV